MPGDDLEIDDQYDERDADGGSMGFVCAPIPCPECGRYHQPPIKQCDGCGWVPDYAEEYFDDE